MTKTYNFLEVKEKPTLEMLIMARKDIQEKNYQAAQCLIEIMISTAEKNAEQKIDVNLTKNPQNTS